MNATTRMITKKGIQLDGQNYYAPEMVCYIGHPMTIDIPPDAEVMPTTLFGCVCGETIELQACRPGETAYFRSLRRDVYLPKLSPSDRRQFSLSPSQRRGREL